MTQEEKAKAYDEALNKIKPLYEQAKRDGNPIWSTYEYFVPELAESEDARVRKGLVKLLTVAGESYVVDSTGIKKESYLAYLEKQKDLDKMIVVSPEVWDNAISDAFENGKKEGEKQKEQNPAKKQDYSGLTDLERAIFRGFLAAGVENVPVGIIKETAQECLTNIKPSKEQMEWLESAVKLSTDKPHIHGIIISLYEQLKRL